MAYNEKENRLYYNGELVRYFEDIVSANYYLKWPSQNGTVDVYAERNASGELTGVNSLVSRNFRTERHPYKLPKLKWVRIKQHRDIPKEYRLKSCTVSQDPDGKYYISVLFAYEKKTAEQKAEKIIGLDFSMKELYVDDKGRTPEYPGFYRKAQERLAREQRKLFKCEKGSNNRAKQRKTVAKLHKKVSCPTLSRKRTLRGLLHSAFYNAVVSLKKDGKKQYGGY